MMRAPGALQEDAVPKQRFVKSSHETWAVLPAGYRHFDANVLLSPKGPKGDPGVVMKRFLLTCAATALTAGAAMAADMSVPFKVGPVAAPLYNWTGCYLGIQGAGAAFRDNLAGVTSDGGMFGGQVGCNYQIDHLVVGVEGEGFWSGVDSSQHTVGFNAGGVSTLTTFKNEWDADIAVRMGVAYDRFLIYGKVGAIWGDHRFANSGSAPAGAFAASGTATLPGIFWGIGLEYGFAPQWTAKIETDFVFFQATDMTQTCTATPGAVGACGGAAATTGIFSESSVAVITKIGVNYRW